MGDATRFPHHPVGHLQLPPWPRHSSSTCSHGPVNSPSAPCGSAPRATPRGPILADLSPEALPSPAAPLPQDSGRISGLDRPP